MKEGTIAAVLNKIKWKGEDLRMYSVVILDRATSAGFREVVLSNVEIKRDRLIINGDTVIPIHRVVAVKKNGEVIWLRRSVWKTS